MTRGHLIGYAVMVAVVLPLARLGYNRLGLSGERRLIVLTIAFFVVLATALSLR